MKRAISIPTQRESIIMACLARQELYGVEIESEYQRRTKMHFPAGSLYVTLSRMEDKGLIRSRIGKPNAQTGGNKRRFFTLTPAGERALSGLRSWLAQVAK